MPLSNQCVQNQRNTEGRMMAVTGHGPCDDHFEKSYAVLRVHAMVRRNVPKRVGKNQHIA